MSITDREHEAAEALADHVHAVGEACLREYRPPTKAELEAFDRLTTELDRVTARAERIAAQNLPIIQRLNEESRKSGEHYRRMLEGRAY